MLRRLFCFSLATSFLLTMAALPEVARADILVLEDGSQVQTEGSWEVRGRVVVFTIAGGALSSLRLEEVDLDASQAATAAAQRAAEAARQPTPQRPERREPILVLTDRDFTRVGPDVGAPQTEDAQQEEPAADLRNPWEPRQRLEVTEWNEAPGGEGLTFVGRVRNTSQDLSGGLRVTATLFDHENQALAVANAELSTTVLQPGQQATFRVRFPEVFHYERVELETSHVAVDSGDPPDVGDVDVDEPLSDSESP